METYRVCDHGREDRSVGIVGIELPHQYRHHGELDHEDDGMEQRLEDVAKLSAPRKVKKPFPRLFVRSNSVREST